MPSVSAGDAASSIREEHGLGFPVSQRDLVAVARRLGAAFAYRHNLGQFGKARTDERGWIVEVDDSLSPRKQLFTTAHEIGHLLLRQAREPYVQSEEAWCNAFASNLIAPTHEVVRIVAGSRPSLHEVMNVSEATGLSIRASYLCIDRSAHWQSALLVLREWGDEWSVEWSMPETVVPVLGSRVITFASESELRPFPTAAELTVSREHSDLTLGGQAMAFGERAFFLAREGIPVH